MQGLASQRVGSKKIPSHFILLEMSSDLMGHLACIQTLPFISIPGPMHISTTFDNTPVTCAVRPCPGDLMYGI